MSDDEPKWIDPAPSRLYTWEEFVTQDWPPCPVCGQEVDVDAHPSPDYGTRVTRYTRGRVRCPRGHTPEIVG